jgi:hypothetical protein
MYLLQYPLHPIAIWLAAVRDGQRPFCFKKFTPKIQHFEKSEVELGIVREA